MKDPDSAIERYPEATLAELQTALIITAVIPGRPPGRKRVRITSAVLASMIEAAQPAIDRAAVNLTDGSVTALAQVITDPPTKAEMDLLQDKVNELCAKFL